MAIGKLHAPFALKGGVKFLSYSEDVKALRKLIGKPLLFLRAQEKFTIHIERVEIKGDSLILFLAGYDNPEMVKEALKGGELYAPRSLASTLARDEFYLSDLIGLEIIYEGNVIGQCVSYFEAAHTVVEVRMQSGELRYFPFIKEYFDMPNFTKKAVVLLRGDLLE
ncbi:ribosome maturation factor RimM [Entomospira culicis]|nr:ribosome maturation factor RimM [Entomospira culicis]WDI37962.1 ribosome maturation factor RimM [Entomospira culicis]WDI39587.1 ribosome maturation factor RimM [Entomospira culicis]